MIEYYTFDRNEKLTSALEEMAATIASPMTLKSTAKHLFLRVNEVLDVDRVVVLVPAERFPDVEFKDISVMKIVESSPVWKYFSQNKDVYRCCAQNKVMSSRDLDTNYTSQECYTT